MRKFNSYNRIRVARYVKGFFNGSLSIEGQGFEFRQGKLLLPEISEHAQIQTVNEVNRTIRKMQQEVA